MENIEAISALAALAQTTRLDTFRLLAVDYRFELTRDFH